MTHLRFGDRKITQRVICSSPVFSNKYKPLICRAFPNVYVALSYSLLGLSERYKRCDFVFLGPVTGVFEDALGIG